MQNRSPIAVFLLSMVTGGIYSWYWLVKTKTEMNTMGEKIPTAWIWLIPCVGSIWWIWKYSEGVEHVTHNKVSGVLAFILLFCLGTIGEAIIQNYFNEDVAAVSAQPIQPTYAQPVQEQPAYQQPVQQQPIYQQPVEPQVQPYQQPIQPVEQPQQSFEQPFQAPQPEAPIEKPQQSVDQPQNPFQQQ